LNAHLEKMSINQLLTLCALVSPARAETSNEPVSSPGVAIAFAILGLGMVFYGHFSQQDDES
jgi:hypothetical protein